MTVTGLSTVVRFPAHYGVYVASPDGGLVWAERATVRARSASQARSLASRREGVEPSRVRVTRLTGQPVLDLLKLHRLMLGG